MKSAITASQTGRKPSAAVLTATSQRAPFRTRSTSTSRLPDETTPVIACVLSPPSRDAASPLMVNRSMLPPPTSFGTGSAAHTARPTIARDP